MKGKKKQSIILRWFIWLYIGNPQTRKVVHTFRNFFTQLFQKKAYSVVLKSLREVSKTMHHFTGFRKLHKGQNYFYSFYLFLHINNSFRKMI